MKFYPVAIHKSPRSAYGVTVLDIPGCFSAGDTLDEALRNVQEALEVHLHGEELAPEPGTLEDWKNHPMCKGAYVVTLAPVDLSFMNDATVRINITAKRSDLAIIDRVAKTAQMDRSAYLVSAAVARAREGSVAKVPANANSKAKANASSVAIKRAARKK